MKVTKAFAPITLVIESEEELKTLKAICSAAYDYEYNRRGFPIFTKAPGLEPSDLQERITHFQGQLQ